MSYFSDYKFNKGEIFKRFKVTTFAELVRHFYYLLITELKIMLQCEQQDVSLLFALQHTCIVYLYTLFLPCQISVKATTTLTTIDNNKPCFPPQILQVASVSDLTECVGDDLCHSLHGKENLQL